MSAATDIRRVPRHAPGEDHARAGRPAELRHAAGARPAPRGSRVAGRRQRRLHRIAENFDVFDFALTAEEVAAIDALDKGVRGGPDPETLSPETYPKVVDNS